MRRKRGRPLDGWLIIDKPPHMTSTDVVNRVRRAFDAQKAGHGGTLDPLATGVLPIAFGCGDEDRAVYVMDGTKLYRFTLAARRGARYGRCGWRGDVQTSALRPTDEQLRAALPAFPRRHHAGAAGVLGHQGGWRAGLRHGARRAGAGAGGTAGAGGPVRADRAAG